MARLRREPSALCTLVRFGLFSYKLPKPSQTRVADIINGVEKPSPLGLGIEPFPKQLDGVETTIEVRLVRGGVAKIHGFTPVVPNKLCLLPEAVVQPLLSVEPEF